VAVVRRRLDVELVRRGLAESRTAAARLIGEGRVLVAGFPATTSARRVEAGAPIVIAGDAPQYVSRGGTKLAGALDAFALSVAGLCVLDAGAPTGGFTDCVLQRGARVVHAVDVGRGQLAWRIRQDPRVVVYERTNVRSLDPARLGVRVDLVVADLSFISLRTVAPALAACATSAADFVLLVKPQFEAGRARVASGGIVRDPAVHAAVLGEVADGLAEHDVLVVDVVASPIRGADGNREFFVRANRTGPRLDTAALVSVVRESVA
jgi:23S rRNA (cytidine1920-2'-O)/16S rRNA (cytidine1409-2'-O)-methyltransferase